MTEGLIGRVAASVLRTPFVGAKQSTRSPPEAIPRAQNGFTYLRSLLEEVSSRFRTRAPCSLRPLIEAGILWEAADLERVLKDRSADLAEQTVPEIVIQQIRIQLGGRGHPNA